MKIALIGAGGKMGVRLANNLKTSSYDVGYVEVSEAGRKRVKEATGADCVPLEAALAGAEAVVLAVPDTAIKAGLRRIVPQIAPGTILVTSTPRRPMPATCPSARTSPTSSPTPAIRRSSTTSSTAGARNDHFGGIAARQAIVNALMQGPEEHYAVGEEIAKTIWAPILRSHRVTVDQMAMLEPGLARRYARRCWRR